MAAEPPGKFIRDALRAKEWDQSILARVLGCSEATISALVNGRRKITVRKAQLLAAAFGNEPMYWLEIENAYRLATLREHPPQRHMRVRSAFEDLRQALGLGKETDLAELIRAAASRIRGENRQ